MIEPADNIRRPSGSRLPVFWVPALFILSCLGVLLYHNSLTVPFILDDYGHIVDNPHIRVETMSPAAVMDVLKSPSTSRPLSTLSFALNYYFHGYHAGGYRIVNLIIHIIAALLVFAIGRRTLALLGEDSWLIPLGAALLWLASPLQVQSVTYIVQRMNLLAAMFYLLSLLCYIHARQIQRRNGGALPAGLLWAAALVCGGLALAGKENAATLPLIIILYEWYFFQNLSLDRLKKQMPWVCVALLTLLVLALLYLGDGPLDKISGMYDKQPFTMAQRLLTQPMVIVYYISLLFFPHPARLILDYDFPAAMAGANPLVVCLAITALGALLLTAVCNAGRHRLVSFAVAWFLVTLSVESSFIGLALIFEHRVYLPAVFPVIALTAWLTRKIPLRPAALGVLISLTLLSGWGTIERNRAWQSKISLWQDTVDKSPLLARPRHNLGLALDRAGRLDEAMNAFDQSLRLAEDRLGPDNPNLINIHNNMGLSALELGNWDRAAAAFHEVLRRGETGKTFGHITRADTFHNLGRAYKSAGDLEQARLYIENELEIRLKTAGPHAPSTAMAYNSLGEIYQAMNDQRQAALFFGRALAVFYSTLGPDHHLTRSARENLRHVTGQAPALETNEEKPKPGARHADEPATRP